MLTSNLVYVMTGFSQGSYVSMAARRVSHLKKMLNFLRINLKLGASYGVLLFEGHQISVKSIRLIYRPVASIDTVHMAKNRHVDRASTLADSMASYSLITCR